MERGHQNPHRRSGEGFSHPHDRGYKVDVHEIVPGIVYQDGNVTVKAFLVNHGEVPQAFGYRFETPDRIIVISGDASPSQSVIDNCEGCDILVHEVYPTKVNSTFANNFAASPAWQAYSARYHTSSAQKDDAQADPVTLSGKADTAGL